jgi:hypothetical protein
LRCPACGADVAEAEALGDDVAAAVEVAALRLLGAPPARAAAGPPGRSGPACTSEVVGGQATAGATTGARRRRRAWTVVVATTAAAAVAVAAAVAAGAPSRPGPAFPTGRVISTTEVGALVSSTVRGAAVRSVARPDATGIVEAPAGRVVATGSGEVLAGPALIPTGATAAFDGAPGSWRAIGFSDGDRALAATEEAPGGQTAAEVEILSGGRTVALGTAEAVAADPAAPGVYAIDTAPSTGPSIERRDVGRAPVGVATAAGLLIALHEVAASNEATALHAVATRLVASVIPDPTGGRVAVTLVSADGSAAGGIVVLGPSGRVFGALRVGGTLLGSPVWSPDGTMLLFATSGGRHVTTDVSVWAVTRPPRVDAEPRRAGSAGTCIWTGSTTFLCAGSAATGPRVPWVLGDTAGRMALVSGPGEPLAWFG